MSPVTTETDHAYAAGIVDGEGTITLHDHGKRTALTVAVFNSEPRVCVWLQERYGGSIGQNIRPDPHRIMYAWRCSSSLASKFLNNIYPYLIIKKQQADIALAYLKTVGRRGQRVEPGDYLHRLDLIERLNQTREHRPPLRAVK